MKTKTTKKILCLLAFLSLFGFVTQEAKAWYPTGWVYANLPWYYQSASSTESGWYWFNDDVWVNDRTTGVWDTFRNRLNQGWLFFSWPYAYSQNQGKWYYINTTQFPWVCHMSTSRWSVFGQLGTGDVQVTLRWDNTADVDLYVKEPSTEEIYYSHKVSATGGRLDVDDRDGYGPENIFWARGTAPRGTYIVSVAYYSGALPINYNVNINGMTYHARFEAGTLAGTKREIRRFTY